MGAPVRVNNGVAIYDGEEYYVSNDGDMVIDKERNIIGYIENGNLKKIDKAHLNALKEKGYIE